MNAGFLKRLTPALLTAVGVGGVVLTSYLTHRGTKKAKEVLDAQNEVSGSEMGVAEELKATWKCYIPAAVSGILTCSAIIGAQVLNAREIAALTATGVYLAKNKDKIEAKLKETVGEENYEEFKKKLRMENAGDFTRTSIEDTGRGRQLCFEGYSGRFFYSSVEDVNRALAKFLEQLDDTGYGSMNDLYDYLGIEKTHFGWQFGYAIGDTGGQDHVPEWRTEMVNYEEKGFSVYCIEPVCDYKSYGNWPMEGWMEY